MTFLILATAISVASEFPEQVNDKNCEEVGVSAEQNDPMLPVVDIVRYNSRHKRKLTQDCGLEYTIAFARGQEELHGCIHGNEEKGFTIRYRSKAGKLHEMCHAKYGPKHLEDSMWGRKK